MVADVRNLGVGGHGFSMAQDARACSWQNGAVMLIAAILLMATQTPVAPPSDATDHLLPVCISGQWGYIDGGGEVVIPFQFDQARRFHDGRAAVQVDNLWHYIDASGKPAFSGKFRQARNFSEGFAAVVASTAADGGWHFISTDGSALAGERRWSKVGDFSDGFAALIAGLGVGYLNRHGVIELQFALASRLPSDFYDGLGAYSFPLIGSQVRSITKSRAINRKGETVFEKEGILTRIPGGFVLQKEPEQEEYQLLDDRGAPWHDDWVQGVALPHERGPVAVLRAGKWQYLVPPGEAPVHAQIEFGFAFVDGLAAAEDQRSGRVGYLDRQGNWAISPLFTIGGDFDRGYAMVKFDDRVCWIDRNSNMIWAPQSYPVQPWELEIAAKRIGEEVGTTQTVLGDEKEALILGEVVGVYRSRLQALAEARVRYGAEVIVDAGPDSESHFVYAVDLSMFFDRVSESHTEFTLAEDDLRAALHYAGSGDLDATLTAVNTSRIADDMRLYRLLLRDAPNLEGQLRVVAPHYHECGEFRDPQKVELHIIGAKDELPAVAADSLPVPYNDPDVGIVYWSPITFEAAFDGTFEDARPFSEGLASARKDGLYGFVDLNGKWAIPPTYANASIFSEGIAMVVDAQTGELGGIDPSGKVVVPFQSNALGDFHQGRARIIREDQWGFIDRSGNEIIAAQYQWTGDFASGLAPFKQDGLCGYLNLNGDVVVKPQYRTATTHLEGMATVVTTDDQMHYLDETGAAVISGKFLFASDFYDGVALVQRENGSWRLIDRAGELHAPVESIP